MDFLMWYNSRLEEFGTILLNLSSFPNISTFLNRIVRGFSGYFNPHRELLVDSEKMHSPGPQYWISNIVIFVSLTLVRRVVKINTYMQWANLDNFVVCGNKIVSVCLSICVYNYSARMHQFQAPKITIG